ncbi:MAG: hypothetical protein ACRDHN_07175, partial [Thermomicrobiales bacterium]
IHSARPQRQEWNRKYNADSSVDRDCHPYPTDYCLSHPDILVGQIVKSLQYWEWGREKRRLAVPRPHGDGTGATSVSQFWNLICLASRRAMSEFAAFAIRE